MNKMWNKYPGIQRDLAAVKEIMKKNVKCNEPTMESALLELINSGGKLLRPAFLLLSGRFGAFNEERLYPLAAVIEMLHMATLVHDDIVDNAESRRNQVTIQARYGKDYAVFMGDYLFCKCFMILSNAASMENMKDLSKAISYICVGEIEQFTSRYDKEVSVKKYLKRIAAKTAALFSMSFYIGASESSCSKRLTSELRRTGYEIGMAFQIIDDLLDYQGAESLIGKPVGNDLKEGIYTLPLIYALQEHDKKLENILAKDTFDGEDIAKIIFRTKELGGIEKARQLAKKYTEKAFSRIKKLPQCESKAILMEITEKLLVRDY